MEATFNPFNRESVKFTPLIVSVVGLVNLKVNTEVPPGEIALGENVFVISTEDGPIMDANRAPVEKSAL